MNASKPRILSARLGLVALYFFLAAAAAMKIAAHERATSQLIGQIAAKQDLNAVTNMDVNLNPGRMGVVTSFLLKITNKNFTNQAKAQAMQRGIVAMIGQLQQEISASAIACLALLLASVLFLAASRFWPGPDRGTPERLIYDLLAVSLVFFVIGIYCPVLTASVKGQHVLVGGFVIETDSKGIISTVRTLFHSGNWMISALLAGFSIGIPIFKGLAVLVTLLQTSAAKRERVGRLLEAIGKWSLTDVVVAAVLLAIFSLNAIKSADGGVTAVPRFALGFFIGYCILAAFTSHLLRRSADRRTRERVVPARIGAAAAVSALALAGGVLFGRDVSLNLLHESAVIRDTALIKLVRTNTEVLEGKFDTRPGHTVELPFTVPFRGTIAVVATAHGKTPIDVAVLGAEGTDQAQPKELSKHFPEEKTASYRHAGRCPPAATRSCSGTMAARARPCSSRSASNPEPPPARTLPPCPAPHVLPPLPLPPLPAPPRCFLPPGSPRNHPRPPSQRPIVPPRPSRPA